MIKNLVLIGLLVLIIGCQKETNPIVITEPDPITIDETFNITKIPLIRLEFDLEDWNKILQNYDLNPLNEKKVLAKYTYTEDGEVLAFDSIGVKLRGNTSRRRPEGDTGDLHNTNNPDWHHCHFSLDFDKYIDNQRFKGMEKFVLKWFKDDANYVREIYSYDLFKRFGVWTAPRASYCRVEINVVGDADPAYYGVYAMIESVNEDFITYRNNKWDENGFMWKGGWSDGYNADFVQTQSIGEEDVSLDPSESEYFAYELKTREDDLEIGKAELITFINNLNSLTGDSFKNWIAQRMDVDLFLKTYATNVMLGMWDDYWVNGNNFYFYFSSNDKAYFIPYDYDNSLGTSLLMPNSGIQDPLHWGADSGRPLINKLLAIPEYEEKYKNYILQLVDADNNYFDPTKSKDRILQWQALVSPYVYNDTGEDLYILDTPASWGNCNFYRLLSGNSAGGTSGNANYFSSKIEAIPF